MALPGVSDGLRCCFTCLTPVPRADPLCLPLYLYYQAGFVFYSVHLCSWQHLSVPKLEDLWDGLLCSNFLCYRQSRPGPLTSSAARSAEYVTAAVTGEGGPTLSHIATRGHRCASAIWTCLCELCQGKVQMRLS